MAIKIINPLISKFEGGGASFNIHYGLTAPEDTSKLWVETDKRPKRTDFGNQYLLDYNTGILEKVLNASAVACVGKKLYIFGGKSGTTNSSSCYVFDTENKTIETLSLTLRGDNIGIGVVGKKIYLFPNSTSVYIYDTETDETTILTGVMPSSKSARAVAVVGTNIYLFGGTSKISTIYCFNTESNTLKTKSATLAAQMFAMGVGVVGTKVYLFGGYASGPLDYVQEYDTETDTMLNLTNQYAVTFPYAVSHMASFTLNSKIYLIGGCYTNTNRFSKIQIFHADTRTFTDICLSLKKPTYSFHAGLCGTKAYLVGGIERIDTSDVGSDCIREFSIFTDGSDLEDNVAYVSIAPTYNVITMEKDDMTFKLATEGIYIGNAEGKAERQKAYIYNGTEWEEI